MRIVALILLVGTTATARADEQEWAKTTTEYRVGVAMRHAWGSADAYEVAGRFATESETEWSTGTLGFELGGGEVGGRGAVVVGATAEWLMFHTAGLGVTLHALRASDDGARYLARAGIGFRMRGMEVSYAYQRPINGDREDWMASHQLVVGLSVPLHRLDW